MYCMFCHHFENEQIVLMLHCAQCDYQVTYQHCNSSFIDKICWFDFKLSSFIVALLTY